jgi:hypothetical protein
VGPSLLRDDLDVVSMVDVGSRCFLVCLVGQDNRTCRVSPAQATTEVPEALDRPLPPPAAPILPNRRGLWRRAVSLSRCREGWRRPSARRTARCTGGGSAGRGACGNDGSCPRREMVVRAHPRIAMQRKVVTWPHSTRGTDPGRATVHGSTDPGRAMARGS